MGAAARQRRQAFSVRRRRAGQAALPRLDRLPAQIVPAPAFPIAEMKLLEPGLDADISAKRSGKAGCAFGRAGNDATPRGEWFEPRRGGFQGIAIAFKIEPAVTQPAFAIGPRMPDEDQTHAAAASKKTIS